MLRFIFLISFLIVGSNGFAAASAASDPAAMSGPTEAQLAQARSVAARAKHIAHGYMADLTGLNSLLEDPEFVVPTPTGASAKLKAVIAQIQPPLKNMFEKRIIETMGNWTAMFAHMEIWEAQLSRGTLLMPVEALNTVLHHYMESLAGERTARFFKDQKDIAINAERFAAEELRESQALHDLWILIGPYGPPSYKSDFNTILPKFGPTEKQLMYFFNGDSIEARYIGEELNTVTRITYEPAERKALCKMSTINIISPNGLMATIPFTLRPTMAITSEPDEDGDLSAELAFPSGLKILFKEVNAAWARDTLSHITSYTAEFLENKSYRIKDVEKETPSKPKADSAGSGLSMEDAFRLMGEKPPAPSKKAQKAAARAAASAKAHEEASHSGSPSSAEEPAALAAPSSASAGAGGATAAATEPKLPTLSKPIDPALKARILELAARQMREYSNPLPERTYVAYTAMLKADGKTMLGNLLKLNGDRTFGDIKTADAYTWDNLTNLMGQLGFKVDHDTFTFDATREFSVHYIHRPGNRLYNALVGIWRTKLRGIGLDDEYFRNLLGIAS